MTARTFYKTIVTIEVLSETPLRDVDLAELQFLITDGDCSGIVNQGNSIAINGADCAKALLRQGADPEFFQIDETGNDIEES